MATKKTTDAGGKAGAKTAATKAGSAKPPAAKDTGGGDLAKQFEKAATQAKSLKEAPDNDMKLRLYSLYKQATEGDVKGEKPGMFDFVGGHKYEAWSKLKGTSREDAQKKYVDLVKRLS
jgi:acyl-CoA-binding protein